MNSTKTISNHAAAARAIRKQLKAHGVAATVRAQSYAGGSSVTVKLEDAPIWTLRAVEQFASRFQMGLFDGMTDSYEYSNRNDDLPQVRFVFVETVYSAGKLQAAWDYARATLGGLEDLPADYMAARNAYVVKWDEYAANLVRRVLRNELGEFDRKPRVRAA